MNRQKALFCICLLHLCADHSNAFDIFFCR